jgi:urease alpha subunit
VFSDWWSYKFEVYYSTAYNAAILTRNGVITSVNSDSGELNRHLYHEAAKSQRYGGLTDDEALALITINPAIQLGIQDRVGSIEIGKDGDVAIFEGHPLSVYTIPVLTYVDGVKVFDRMTCALMWTRRPKSACTKVRLRARIISTATRKWSICFTSSSPSPTPTFTKPGIHNETIHDIRPGGRLPYPAF